MAEKNTQLSNEELLDRIVRLEKKASFNEMPALIRFNKNVSMSPGVRFRFENTDNFGVLGTASKEGELAGTGAVINTTPTAGVWVPIKSYSEPLTKEIAANTDNMSIATTSNAFADYILLNNTSGASKNLTGILAAPIGTEIVLLNISAQNVVIKYDVTSTSANRFITLTGADVTLAANQSIRFRYRNDAGMTRWMETN